MKKTVAVTLVLLLIAVLVAVGVVVIAQDQEPETERDGIAGGGGEREGDNYSLTDVIGLPAVGHTRDGNVDLYAGMIWLGGAQPFVSTDPATGLAPHSGTLNGTLHNMGSADSVDVCFEWGTSPGAPYAYRTGTLTLTGTGSFSVSISGLLDNQNYYYRAYAEGDGYDFGEMVNFKTPNEPGVIYVNAAAAEGANGTSWSDAYNDLQAGFARAGSGDEIWVAAGTYTPGNDRISSFQIKNEVSIFGGFTGTEGSRSERNWYLNRTILSGDIGIKGSNSDNCYQVISGRNVGGSNTVIDGFTISGGKADSATGNYNTGGAVYLYNGSPVFRNCVFTDNSAEYGGAMYNYLSAPQIVNCTWWNNATAIISGEVASVQQASLPELSDQLTTEQVMAGGWLAGGAMYNENSDPVMTNCIFSANSSEIGGAVFSDTASQAVITNCILWNNVAPLSGPEVTGSPLVTYSDVKGGSGDPWFGVGCIDEDPVWASPSNGDFHLKANSPCVDGGTDSAIPVGVTTDFEGHGRIIGGTVDMGVDEFQAIFVNDDAAGANDGSSWFDAYTSLQDALAVASNGAEIWVASGTYTPGISRTDYFQMKQGVKLYGGFDGISGTLSGRNWHINKTVLSGDIGVKGVSSDNCYHVFYHTGILNLDSTSVLDGFTITGGNANGNSENDYGGGMYNDASSPTIINCNFLNNTAAVRGAGIYNTGNSSPQITNCIFFSNSSLRGGAMYNFNVSSLVLTNCNLYGNSADIDGGAVYNHDSSPTITNCILWGNTGGQLYNQNSLPTVTYSNIENGYPGKGNTEGTPMFVNSINGDFHLQAHSPCINAGTNSAPSLPLTDFEKNNRIMQDKIDIGVDETCAYTLLTSSGNGGLVSVPGEGSYQYYCLDVVPISAQADPCYQFDRWTGSGSPAVTNPGSPNTTITMDADHSITASFTLKTGNLTLTDDGGHATITPYEGTQLQNCGATVNIDVTGIDPCYSFNQWTGDTAYLTGPATQASNSIVMPDGDVSLTATFTVYQYDLTTASGIGGSVTQPGEGVFAYDCGTVVPIVAEPDLGYVFSGWTGPGTPSIANPGSPNTTITMDDHKSINAVFQQVETTVDIYVVLQGDNRPYPSGWQVPIEVGFFPANSGTLVMNGSPSAIYWFKGTTTGTVTGSGTRAYFQCPGLVAVGTYDITTDTSTTLMNVRRAVGIW